MFFEIQNVQGQALGGGSTPISVRCPACKQQGTLDSLSVPDFLTTVPGTGGQFVFAQRRCPNPDCHKQIFVISHAGRTVVSYPPERLDFDSTNIPPGARQQEFALLKLRPV